MQNMVTVSYTVCMHAGSPKKSEGCWGPAL